MAKKRMRRGSKRWLLYYKNHPENVPIFKNGKGADFILGFAADDNIKTTNEAGEPPKITSKEIKNLKSKVFKSASIKATNVQKKRLTEKAKNLNISKKSISKLAKKKKESQYFMFRFLINQYMNGKDKDELQWVSSQAMSKNTVNEISEMSRYQIEQYISNEILTDQYHGNDVELYAIELFEVKI